MSTAPSAGQRGYSPDEDDDGGGLGHGSDHAAHADHTQEGEEGLLAAWTGALSWQSHSLLAVAGDTRAAAQVLAATRRHSVSDDPAAALQSGHQ